MTVSSTNNRVSFAGDGSTTVFSFPYYFTSQSDLLVTLTNNSTGAITTKVITTDYTVSGTLTNGVYAGGGSVTMVAAPAAGFTLSIIRVPSLTQATHWVDGDPDPAAVKEAAIDKATIQIQRHADLLSRAITLPDGFSSAFNTQLPAVLPANYGLVINASGNGFAVSSAAGATAGTVTSVALSLPGDFTVTGSPVTASGTLTASWNSVVRNTMLAGPTSGSNAAPTFRALVAADIPVATLNPNTMSSGAATSGQVLKADGAGGASWSSVAGTGTVTSVALSTPAMFTVGGSPVTGAGTLSFTLASQAQNLVFASPNGSSGTPTFRSLVGVDVPAMTGATGGANGTQGTVPAPAAGQQALFLRGDATWAGVPTGTVTSVALSTPPEFTVSGSPISVSGTLSFTKASQSANTFFAAPSGSSGTPTFRGIGAPDLPIFVGATGIAAGTQGAVPAPLAGQQTYFLTGAGTWSPIGASPGTVTSVGLAMPPDFTVSGSPVTTTGNLTAAWANQNANLIHAGPASGGAATPTWRALVGADLPVPSATTLGGVQSIAAVGSKWINTISTSGVPNLTQPAFSDISGTVAASQLPNPSATTLGGVQSAASQASKWINSISTSGVPALSQPAFSDISGTVAASQLPNPTNSTLGGVQSVTGVLHQWINSISTSGIPQLSQPAFSDISGSVAATQMPALTGDVTTSAGAVATTIAANAVTNAKAAQMPANTIKGNNTGAPANASDLTAAQALALISPLTTKGDLHTFDTVNNRLAVGADGTLLTADSTQATGIKWSAAPSGIKNYITNPNFEFAITPWSLFNTTLTSGIPSGGITLTASSLNALARTSTNPLAGTNSLQVSSAGAVTAGQGFISGAFTIDRKDEGKVLYFQVPYEVVSGSANIDFSGTSTQTFAVYIYDVTASAWIQPTGFRGMNQAKNPGMITGSFQASVVAGQQYQLAVLAINASGGAVTINFDEMLVGPQTIVTGAAVSDAQAYTPTLTGFGTPTGVSAFYRRNGDKVECWGVFTSGTSTAVAAKIGLPNSYSIDTSKLSIDQSASLGDVTIGVGAGSAYPNSSTAGPFKITQSNATDSHAVFMSVSTNTSNMFTLANGSNIAASGQVVAFQFAVPVLGWSSNVQLSQDTDTRVVAALLTAGTFTINNTFQDVTFTATRDSNGAYSGTNYTVQVSGWYEINADMRGGTSTASAQIGLKLFKNGSQIKDGTDSYVLTGANQWVRLHYKDYFVAGDILKLQAALPTGVTVVNAPVMDITRVGGPSVIAASEAVNASYNTTAGGAVAASTTTFIDFGTKEWDSHGAVLGAGGGNTTTVQTGWRYVVQTPGKYRVTSQVTYANQSGGAANLNFYVYQNASVKANAYVLSTTSVASYACNFGRTLNCLAGDTIQIAVNQNAGASTLNTGAGTNYVNIELVK